MSKMGRPRKEINPEQLKALMRLNPTLEDTAAFFECSADTVEKRIRDYFDLTFAELRAQNIVHTRLSLRRSAIKKAEGGDNTMIIWCMKNLDNWTDKVEQKVDNTHRGQIEIATIAIEERVKQLKEVCNDQDQVCIGSSSGEAAD